MKANNVVTKPVVFVKDQTDRSCPSTEQASQLSRSFLLLGQHHHAQTTFTDSEKHPGANLILHRLHTRIYNASNRSLLHPTSLRKPRHNNFTNKTSTTTNTIYTTSNTNACSLHTRYQHPDHVRRKPIPVREQRCRSWTREPDHRGATAQAGAGEESSSG